jgi:hypothetical protein
VVEAKVYRAGRWSGLPYAFVAAWFLVIGVLGVFDQDSGLSCCFWIPVLLSAELVLLCIEVPFRRLVVDERGVTHRSCLGKTHIPWEAVEAWLAVPPEIPKSSLEGKVWAAFYPADKRWARPTLLGGVGDNTDQEVIFRLRGQRWLAHVNNLEQWRPSFDVFVADIRARLPDKEIVIPGLARPEGTVGPDPDRPAGL